MISSSRAAELVRRFGLEPHPEGGFYREVHRGTTRVTSPAHDGERAALTHIEFLLEGGSFSAWHVVVSDELWHHYSGDPLELHLLHPARDDDPARHRIVMLGPEFERGHVPHAVVPAGVYQAARTTGAFSLMGCTVAPGFEFRDFAMPGRAELLRRFPEHAPTIEQFTR